MDIGVSEEKGKKSKTAHSQRIKMQIGWQIM